MAHKVQPVELCNQKIGFPLDATIPEPDIPIRDDQSLRSEFSSDPYRGRMLGIHVRVKTGSRIFTKWLQPLKEPRSAKCPLFERSSFITRYSIGALHADKHYDAPEGMKYNILAGAYRSIVYTTAANDITSSPLVHDVLRYSDDAANPPPAEMRHSQSPPKKRFAALRSLGASWNPYRVNSLAWDETIGRLCMIVDGEMHFHFMEFSMAPKAGKHVDVPLIVPLVASGFSPCIVSKIFMACVILSGLH